MLSEELGRGERVSRWAFARGKQSPTRCQAKRLSLSCYASDFTRFVNYVWFNGFILPRVELTMDDLFVNQRLTIPAAQVQASYSRSSGPGGQNVNKVSSRVTLRWQVVDQPLLPPGWGNRLMARYGNRVTRDGELLLHSDRYRDQPRNLADCRSRLVVMLLDCANPPIARKKTAPSRRSQQRRMDDKRRTGDKKIGRRDVRNDG